MRTVLFMLAASVVTLPLAAGTAYAEETGGDSSSEAKAPAQLPEPAFGTDAEEAMDGISFSLAANSRYADESDLYLYTPAPVAQAEVVATFGACNASAWGSHAIDPKDHRGWEVEVVGGCGFKLAPNTTIEASAGRYFLAGPDITVVGVTLTQQLDEANSVEVTAGKFLVDGPDEDATRVQVAWNYQAEKFDLRLMGTYESGFDDPDIVTAMARAEYYVTEHVSFNITGVIPVIKKDYDERKAQVMIGIKYWF